MMSNIFIGPANKLYDSSNLIKLRRHFVAASEFNYCKIIISFHILQKSFQILVPVEKAAGSVMLVLVVTEVVRW